MNVKPPMPNTLKESTQRKKVVKAWAIVITKNAGRGRIADNKFFDSRQDARDYRKYTYWKSSLPQTKIIPCTITYNISK